MTDNPCACTLEYDPKLNTVLIIYCPTHANAFKLREFVEGVASDDYTPSQLDALVRMAKQALHPEGTEDIGD